MKVSFNPIKAVKSFYYANRPLPRYKSVVRQANRVKYMNTSMSVMENIKNFIKGIFKK